MPQITPSSAEDLAQTLLDAALKRRTVAVIGNNSKRLMGGPQPPADVVISTAALRRVLDYEPNDLTVSVEAGMPFADLQTLLSRRRQMIALDPPFSAQATVGGVIASNSSGPMRRAFGTARDLVIGMSFATLDGKTIQTGGMVVKNVAGLDMGKLMIGSFGTLAVITSVNFRLHSLPKETRTFLFSFAELDPAIEKRNQIVRSLLQPMAVELITPAAAARIGNRGYLLVIRAGGSHAIIERYARDLGAPDQLSGDWEAMFWQQVREFSPDFLRRHPSGAVLRISSTLQDVGPLLRLVSGACISRAASGVTYVYLTSWQGVPSLWKAASERGWSAVVEFAPDEIRNSKELWLSSSSPGSVDTLSLMKKVKQMFDPENLLNRSRLYGRI
ncbi:MAG: FAD-binding oxidoreductase [Bryobacteraceae bacterium]